MIRNPLNRYIGRFAPSPTGPLHLGSLYAALASYLDARHHNGLWLLRIDDVDTPRNIPGSADSFLNDLQRFGLVWDGKVCYQSHMQTHYLAALHLLQQQDQIYPCTCSRKQLAHITRNTPINTTYPGFCRNKRSEPNIPYAIRVKTDQRTISFCDRLQGQQIQYPYNDPGDFIIRRKDTIFAYQFAVVIDDYQQQVNHVVRGHDLLASTARQIYMQQLLNYPMPTYMHIPVITDQHGDKLSKQTHATPVDSSHPARTLYSVLHLLQQSPPTTLAHASVQDILNWGIENWQPMNLKKIRAIAG